MVGSRHKDLKMQPVEKINVYSHIGTGNSRNSGSPTYSEVLRRPVSNNSAKDGQQDSRHSRCGVRDSFSQEGGNYNAISRGSTGKLNIGRFEKFGEASRDRITPPIQQRPSDNSFGVGNRKSDLPPENAIESGSLFREFLRDMPQEKIKHTIVRTKRATKLATKENFHLPLHVKFDIPQINFKRVMSLMNEETRQRCEYLRREMFDLLPEPEKESPQFFSVPLSDVQLLIDAGFVSKVSHEQETKRPTNQWVIPFTVVEPDGDDGICERRRFIAWTRADNARIRESYVPSIPLRHAAYYLHQVKQDYGIKRDLACSFYQVGIPIDSRAKFRFRSGDGHLYELTVMPMGHRCAPELMHSITAVLAGDPQYCSKEDRFPVKGADVYIDGIRFAGDFQTASKFGEFVDRRSSFINARFKDHGTPPQQNYIFNGVSYLHREKKVALVPKIVARLRKHSFRTITYDDLESAVGRMIYASGILGEPLPEYHMILKIVRRRINALNRNPDLGIKRAMLPAYVGISLTRWNKKLTSNIPVTPLPHPDAVPHNHTLFTDASSKGWGAVLYLDYGQMLCAGDKYEYDKSESRFGN